MLWVRIPPGPLINQGSGGRGQESGVREKQSRIHYSPSDPCLLIPVSSFHVLAGQGLWPPSSHGGDRGFESHLGFCRQGRQPADHLGSNPGMLWVQLPPLLIRSQKSAVRSQNREPMHEFLADS